MTFEYYGKQYEVKNEKDINEFLNDLNDEEEFYTRDWFLWTFIKVLMSELDISNFNIVVTSNGRTFVIGEEDLDKFTKFMTENNDEELFVIFCNELHITPIRSKYFYSQIILK